MKAEPAQIAPSASPVPALLALLLLVAAQIDGARLDEAAPRLRYRAPAMRRWCRRWKRTSSARRATAAASMILARQHFAADRFDAAARL